MYGLYYWGIPAAVNLPERVNLIEKILSEQTGMNIKLEKPNLKMGYLPSFKINADEIYILNDDNSKALDIKNSFIDIKILPLIFNCISINKFSADKIDANLVYDGDFKLGQYNINDLPKSKQTLNRASIYLNDYNINLEDKLQHKTVFLDGQYLNMDKFINNKQLILSTIAELYTGQKKSSIKADLNFKLPITNITNNQFKISGHIVNIDLSDFSEYIKTLSENKIQSTSGLINITADTDNNNISTDTILKDIFIKNEDTETSIKCDDKLEIKGNFSTINNGINIHDLKIKGKDINIYTQGQITKLNSKLPHLDIITGVTKSKAESILALLPPSPDLDPDIDLYTLKKAGFWGDASAYLEIKGKADYPSVTGNVLINNAYMVRPIPNSDKATIKLAFTGDKFNLDVRVPTSPTQTVWVKGPINLDKDRTADLNITSTDNVDLKTAQIVLNPLHKALRFDLGPVPIMDIQGKGGINLRVTGTKKNPHAWGKFFFNSATVSFLDIKETEIKNGSGELNFDNQNTVFKSNTANLNGKPISITGTCSLYGDMNFDVKSDGQDLGKLIRTVQISPMLKDIQTLISNFKSASGQVNVKLNLKGHVPDVNDIVFNKNLFAKGTLELLSDTINLRDIPISVSKVNGIINFNNLNTDFDLSSWLKNSNIKIYGKTDNDNCNIVMQSDKFNLKDGIDAINFDIPFKSDLASVNSSFTAKYTGKIDKIEYDKINIKGKLYSNIDSKSNIIVNQNSDFELNNSNFKLSDLKGTLKNNPYSLNLRVSKLFSQNPVINGSGKIYAFDLTTLNDKYIQNLLPKEISDIEFLSGNPEISFRAKNNNINIYTVLNNINLIYKPLESKITVNSGNILLQNTTLHLNKINALIDNMPVFADGKVYSINKKNPNLNLYTNLKPNQEFFDKIFNKKSIYPIKLKGDMIVTSKITGNLDNINTKSTIDINENSTLYYMGATVGDINNPVKITVDSNYSPNKIKINGLQYDKMIMSQNNKPFINTQLNASGTLTLLSDNNVGFNNFKIKTQNPTDAKIFNIIFRKPFMKQGVFTSDLTLNGTSIVPRILGTLNITSIDIPFFDSTIRDINLNFKNDKIYVTSKGTVLTNDVLLEAIIQNKLQAPYIVDNLKLKLADLDINKITDTLNDIEAESARNLSSSQQSAPFDISQFVIKKGEIYADKIKVRNINADNFKTNLRVTNKNIVEADKFKFDIAEGSVLGKLSYNLKNKNAALNLSLNNANSSVMSEALFDLKGQVYGSIDGNFELSCKSADKKCLETLSGFGNFKIANGRMPKLGSLEYLLKAGNLFKSGFTTLSINSLIDLVTPLKTGDFKSISGDIHLTDGIADSINIYSSGNDLNMYMNGNYNLSNSIAKMNIYGSLSKNITTVSGKIKNASLNTLFNTIPGVSDSTEKLLLQTEISKIPNLKDATDIYRIFAVDIEGNINGSDYVRSFRWVK